MNYLTIHEIESALAAAMENSARDHLMLLLSFRHGMRREEVTQLTMDDVQNGQIYVERLKGSNTTRQPLLTSENELFDEVAALNRWLQFRPSESNFLFPSREKSLTGKHLNRIAKRYLIQAGVCAELAHHHAFKHACCTIMRRNGAEPEYLRQWVGHADIKNTFMYYIHVSDEEAAEAANKALSLALAGSPGDAGATAGV